jgi:thiamine biosynthesis lipoprotein
MKRIIALIEALLISVGLIACSAKGSSLKKYQATYTGLFDTVTVITGYEADEETFNKNAELIYSELEYCHKLFDIYNSYEGLNNLKTINDKAGVEAVKVDERLIGMLKYAAEMTEYTGGRFNIAMGSVLALWHEAREYGSANPDKAALPDADALKKAAEHIDIGDMIIDENNKTVYLADPYMSLDAGGIGKGYAVEVVSRLLRDRGIEGYLIAAGGNIETVGGKEGGGNWTVGIENPLASDEEEAYKHILELKDLAVVTSGSYQRFYTVNGVRYHHIIDPVTLYPKNTFVLITVVSDYSAKADALSTALFNMSFEEGLKLIVKTEGTEAYWLYPDGTEKYSDGLTGLMVS